MESLTPHTEWLDPLRSEDHCEWYTTATVSVFSQALLYEHTQTVGSSKPNPSSL